jgi:hypothetical protein
MTTEKQQITYYDVRKKLEAMAKELEDSQSHLYRTNSNAEILKFAASIVFNYFEGSDQ